MQPYPHTNSVLVLDNARIHHDPELVKYIEAFGCKIEYLPPYSPDMNPIETAFAWIKAFIKKHRDFMQASPDSIYNLMVVCAQITPQLAEGFFKSSIYL